MHLCTVADSEVKAELAVVKAGMQGLVDMLQSKLNYWQNVTLTSLPTQVMHKTNAC